MFDTDTNTNEVRSDVQNRVQSLVTRIENLEEEKRSIMEDIKEVYSEAKSEGFDTKALRQVIRIRRMDRAERQELEALVDLYMSVL